MSNAGIFSAASPGGIEYSVYIFHQEERAGKAGQDQALAADWERTLTTSNMKEALQKAHILFESKRYRKVEVKKKFFDSRLNRNIDMTLKVFEDHMPDNWRKIAAILTGFITAGQH